MSVQSKEFRLRAFLQRLDEAPAVSTDHAALTLIAETLNAVEDVHSGLPYHPDMWPADGRMYPPQPDSERKSNREGYRLFRNRGHYTYVGLDGSIEIQDLSRRCVFYKRGGSGA